MNRALRLPSRKHTGWAGLSSVKPRAGPKSATQRASAQKRKHIVTQIVDMAARVPADPDRAVPARDAGQLGRVAPPFVWQVSLGALQILGLWALNIAGVWIVEKLSLPIPGNLVGMAMLYGLLALGIVKLCWLSAYQASRVLFCTDYRRSDGYRIAICDPRYRDHHYAGSKPDGGGSVGGLRRRKPVQSACLSAVCENGGISATGISAGTAVSRGRRCRPQLGQRAKSRVLPPRLPRGRRQ
jgi:hypothetical protein